MLFRSMKYNLISLSIFHESAVILVSIFFFFSGYGVSINIRKNPDYMGAHFWKKRIGYLLLPMIFLDLIMFLWRAFEGDVNISFWNYLLGKELFNGQTWYIRELMICYIFFYFLIRKYKESKKVIAGCAAFLTLMNIILYICGYGYQWYGSNYGFLIGVYAGYQGIWSRKQNKHTLVYAGILSFLMTGILSILYKIVGKEADWNLLLTRNAMTFFATIFYICVASVLKIKSGEGDRISEVSMEIFLVHMIVIEVCVKCGLDSHPFVFVFMVLVMVIFFSNLYHKLLNYVRRGIYESTH